ncbi:MAG: segregation/condensation protein A [Acidobacteriota bacterium]|nr:segregation/condensation protein A [Acidobacteriota bacterium]MDH3785283.1 segregation/condensation protein A [Acidobacteriota bacterium]
MSDVEPTTGENTKASAYHGHRVHVGSFDGPLDLLLHLVRINEVEIVDLPVVEITEQYNAHLEMMRDFNLEVAGEYLVMAATLMHIKSRMLLPPDPEAEGEEGAEDPRAELAQQLLEYQRFKQAAETLQAMDSRRQLIWTRDRVAEEFADEEMLSVEMFDLLTAFRSLLGRLGDEARLQLRRDTVSVADKIQWLTDLLERRSSINLLELIADLPTRLDRIAAFLALLEMLRLQLAAAFQRSISGEIRIVAVDPRDRAQTEFSETTDTDLGDDS